MSPSPHAGSAAARVQLVAAACCAEQSGVGLDRVNDRNFQACGVMVPLSKLYVLVRLCAVV